MRPWSADQPPRAGDARPRRNSGMPVPEQDSSLPGRPAQGPNSWGLDQPAGTWSGSLPPFGNQAPPNRMAPPPGMSTPPGMPTRTASRPMTSRDLPQTAPKDDSALQAMALGRFGRATGLSLKLRFLLALTLLSMAPAFILVLLYQQANQASLTQAGQQTLVASAQSNGNALTQELKNRQAHLARLAKQNSIAQTSNGTAGSDTVQQAERLLSAANLSSGDALAWLVLNKSDKIVAASPASAEGQSLSAATAILTRPSDLENFVQAQRKAPAPKAGETPLLVASGIDDGLADRVWVATLAFVSPATPAQSGVVLAVFSLPAIVEGYLSALPSNPNSYAALFDTQGTILGVVGNKKLADRVGQPVSITRLQEELQALQQNQSGSEQIFNDPTTGMEQTASGTFMKDLGWICLVVAPAADLAPSTTGLLAGRNLPLIFLTIIVITTLVATWVALPIVRPIRRATREILASTDDVRVLAEQAKQIAKDQRLGTDILEGAAKGLDLRRRAIGRDASLIANSATAAATRLAQLAYAINELPEAYQAPMQLLSREIYQELQTAHQLATSISSGLESDPVQKRLGNVMEGAAEISQQFDQASQQLERGAGRLERAAETLQ